MELDSLVNNYLKEGFLHGVNLLVGVYDKDLLCKSYGFADNLHTKKMTKNKVFDLASLTKAIGISLITATLKDEGKLDYNQTIDRYLPNLPIKNYPYGFPKVIDLLIHHSGVDSERYYDKYMLLGHEELYKAFVHNITGVGEPNQKYEYNCSNYILLGLIIEAITKQPLNTVAKKYIFDKLNLNDTSWGIPLQHTLNDVVTPRLKTTHGATPKELVSQEIWNLHLNDQLPSDETARWVLPYCIGNAGMFSNLKDLSKIARFILSKPFRSSSMNLLSTNQSPKGSHPRTCGFDYEDEGVFSPNTIHHTGWSGQSLWIDFEKNLFVIVLTCRSNILDGQRKARLEIAKAALKELKKLQISHVFEKL